MFFSPSKDHFSSYQTKINQEKATKISENVEFIYGVKL